MFRGGGGRKAYYSWLTDLCKLQTPDLLEVDRGVCEKLVQQSLIDLITGSIPAELVNDSRYIKQASISPFHALSVAAKLANETSNYFIVVTVLDSNYSGIVFIVSTPGGPTPSGVNGVYSRTEVLMCGVDTGIYIGCNDPAVLVLWPRNVTSVRIYRVNREVFISFVRDIVKLFVNSS